MRKLYSTFFLAFLVLFSFRIHSQQPQEVGQWSDRIPFGLVPVAVANLPDGRILAWSSRFRGSSFDGADGATYFEIFDPNIGQNGTALGVRITPNNHNMFCPGINNLPDGRILVAGGGGAPRTTIYDPQTDSWTPDTNMNVPRAYQGNATLADGSVFTIGGQWDGGRNGKVGEIWTPADGWRRLNGLPMEMLWNNNDLAGNPARPADHPWVWAAPNGKVFHAGPSEDMHWLDLNGQGSYTYVGKRGDDSFSFQGTTVMYDVGKILKVGGAPSHDRGQPANDRSYVIDINNENNVTVTKTVNDLAFSRVQHNSVVLPNGEVLVTGGLSTARIFTDQGARFNAEIWNPDTNRWKTLAGMQIPRTYHSVSLLMLDGRVFVGGGGLCGGCGVNHEDAEIYSPPYLFDSNGNLADRPEISAPETAQYNQTLQVQSGDTVDSFSFIRMSSVTHSINNEQRRVPVSFSRNGNTYSLNVPGPNLMPPGYYMLFAMDQNGVPSIAEVVQVVQGVISVTGVEVNPDTIELTEGRINSLTAIVSPSFASDQTVSWSSADSSIATVDDSGNITAIGVGTTTITVTTNDGGFTAQTSVTVNEGDGLCIANGTILMERYNGIGGVSLQELFNSPAYPNNPSSTQELNSFEIPTNVADDYGVRVSGYLCAPETGTYYFWVSGDDESRLDLSTDNNSSNVATIANVPGWTSSREWNKYSTQKSIGIQLVQGLSYYIEAFMKESGGGDNLAVGWRKPSDGNGSAPTEVIPGNVLSTTLQLAPINVTGVSVIPTSLNLTVGDSSQLTSTIEPADADDTSVIWSSSDTGVATVDSNGQVTAIDEGEATITVTTIDGGFEAISTITVERAPVFVTGVTLNVSTLDLIEGETGNLIATVNPTDADDTSVEWSSSDESVAVVDENGEVTAVAEGTAIISVVTNDGGFDAQAQVNVASLQIPRPTQSTPIMVDAESRRVWVVNPDNNSISVLDADSLQLIAEYTVAADPVSVAKDAQGNIWVASRDTGVVQVLNPQGSIVNTISVGRGSQPYAVVNDPAGEYIYVTLFAADKVVKINATSQAIVDELSVFARPRAMAITSDGLQLMVTQFITENNQGKIARIDLNNFELNSDVTIAEDNFSPNSSSAAKGIANYLGGIALHPDNNEAWFTAKKDNVLTGTFRSGQELNFATTVRAMVSRFSTVSGQENVNDRIDIDNHSVPTGITVSPAGNYVFITMLANNRIIVLDAASGFEVLRQDVGFAPSGIIIDSESNRVFVKNFLSRSVHVFDANSLITQDNQNLTFLSEINTVSNERLSNQVLQGKQIFYNARDSRMTLQENSDAGYISCASCHIDGTHDGQTWDFTQRGEGLRNTISLRGKGGTDHGNVHWTGNFDEIHDFEGDMRFAFGGTGFMNDQDFFSENRENPLGGTKAGKSAELDALNAYIESLNSFDESPNKNENGTMTSEALQGRGLFNNLQCASCHSGEAFTNSPSGLLHDIGTLGQASGTRLGRTLQGLDVPSLRDSWSTGPYLHDGSATSISEAISRHASASNLSQNDLNLLETYILQLDGSEVPAANGISFELQMSSTASLGEPVALSVSTDIPNINEVIYYAGDIEIGRVSNAPYTLDYLPSEANNYCIYAKAVHQGMATISKNQTLTIIGENNQNENRSLTLEGEDFTAVENAIVGDFIPGFQSTGFLDMGANASFGEWQFENNLEGAATVRITYSNGHLANRFARVEVNGNSVGEIEFLTSPNCFGWQSIELQNVDLQEGLNSIRIITTSFFGGVDIDFLSVELPIQPVTSVAINPGTLDLTEGEIGQLTATISPSDASDQSVSWSTSDDSIALVDNEGNVTAISAGTATITVTTNDGGFEASATVEVNELLIAVTGISLNTDNLILTEGESGSLTETISPSDASDQSVSWSSSDDSIALVDNEGNVTAISAGTATITVTTNDGGFEASATVEVNELLIAVTGISLNTDNLILTEGESGSLTETISPSDASDQSVSWSSSDDSIALVDNEGNVTAISAGTATITVTTNDGGFEASATVEVNELLIAVTGISLNTANLILTEGESGSLTETISPSDASDQSVSWSSSDDSIALVDNEGNVTAISAGTATITVTTNDGGFEASATVEVNELLIAVTGISLNTDNLILTEGESGSLTETISPSDASDQSVSWSSSDDSIALVDNEGNVTAISAGTATITVTTNDGGFEASATVEVNELLIAVTGISLNTDNLILTEGESGSLTETISPSDASDQSVSWSSSDDSIALVDNEGNVTAISAGTATITVTTNDGGFEASATVNVSAISINVTGVTLTPEILSLAVGDSQVLNASVLPSNADNKDIIWYTSDASVASISDTGEVTALFEGTSVLTARTVDGGFEAYSTLTVFPDGGNGIAVTGVTLSPEIFSMAVGESQVLNAAVLPSNADNQSLVWYTSDDSVATIDENGEVTALSEGTSVLTARTVDGGFEAYSTLTVFPGGGSGIAVTGVTLSPEIFSMAVGESQVLNAVVLPSNADNQSLIWYTSDASVASISDAGEVSAISEGTSVLTARTLDGGFEAYSSLTVFSSGGSGIAVTGVTLQPESLSISVGQSRLMEAEVIPSNADNQALIWYTSDASVASISSSGEVYALSEGTSVLTARTVDGGFEAYSVVTVISGGQGVAVTGVTLEPELLSITIGETIGLTATIIPSNADNTNLIWYTSDPNVATIGSTGELTAVGEGVTVITARTVDGGFEAYSTVTAVSIQLGALSIVPGELAKQEKVLSSLMVSPNPIPINERFSISFVSFVKEQFKVELWDYNGRLVKRKLNNAKIGLNLIDMESVNISAGNYIVTVSIFNDVIAKQILFK